MSTLKERPIINSQLGSDSSSTASIDNSTANKTKLTCLPNTCSIVSISICIWPPPHTSCLHSSHTLTIERLQTPPASQIPHVLCGPSFSSHGPQTIFHHFKKCLWKKGVPAMALWWWQRGKKRNLEPSTALFSLMDWFSWGHHVPGNNFLSTVPYRGKFIYCQMYIVLTLSIRSTFLWLALPSTCGPNWCILCTGLFSCCSLWWGLCINKSKPGIFFLSNLSNSCFVSLGQFIIAFAIPMWLVDSLIDKKLIDQFW